MLEPAVRSRANKGRRFPAELLSSEEVRALLRACSSRAPTGIRNRALIAVLYRGGLRISEALDLLPKDVDSAQGTLTVLHGVCLASEQKCGRSVSGRRPALPIGRERVAAGGEKARRPVGVDVVAAVEVDVGVDRRRQPREVDVVQ